MRHGRSSFPQETNTNNNDNNQEIQNQHQQHSNQHQQQQQQTTIPYAADSVYHKLYAQKFAQTFQTFIHEQDPKMIHYVLICVIAIIFIQSGQFIFQLLKNIIFNATKQQKETLEENKHKEEKQKQHSSSMTKLEDMKTPEIPKRDRQSTNNELTLSTSSSNSGTKRMSIQKALTLNDLNNSSSNNNGIQKAPITVVEMRSKSETSISQVIVERTKQELIDGRTISKETLELALKAEMNVRTIKYAEEELKLKKQKAELEEKKERERKIRKDNWIAFYANFFSACLGWFLVMRTVLIQNLNPFRELEFSWLYFTSYFHGLFKNSLQSILIVVGILLVLVLFVLVAVYARNLFAIPLIAVVFLLLIDPLPILVFALSAWYLRSLSMEISFSWILIFGISGVSVGLAEYFQKEFIEIIKSFGSK